MLGQWMAAVLCAGPGAVLSHRSAAELWGILRLQPGPTVVSIPSRSPRRRAGIVIHRRSELGPEHVTSHQGIPLTTVVCTFVDIAPLLSRGEFERAIGEADKLGLTDPESLREGLAPFSGWRGIAVLRTTLDRHTVALTESELERAFLSLARRAGLPPPQTQQWVNGFRVDFFWPELGLVVETDGLTYHRTPAQQNKDLRRKQAHLAAGLTPLSFSHSQVYFEPRYVEAKLAEVAALCRRSLARE